MAKNFRYGTFPRCALWFFLITFALIGIRTDAQQTSPGITSNDRTSLELCCGRKESATGDKKLGVYKAAVGIFRGKLKELNNKDILIENEFKQLLSIRRSHKTTFFMNNQVVAPSGIELESSVTIDASEAANGSLLAINVSVDSPPTKTSLKVDHAHVP